VAQSEGFVSVNGLNGFHEANYLLYPRHPLTKGFSMTELEELRREKDNFFKTHPQSPLTPEQKKTFTGLSYFPESPALRLEVKVEEFARKEVVVMQTSTGDVREYQKFGKFKFAVEEQEAELTIYAAPYGGYFLPFVDSLAGTETYGAGRYLEPEPLGGGKIRVDFNLAYNPYCAYNEPYWINPLAENRWSCPIPPAENRLKVPIRAGEKLYYPEEPPEGQ
jgi:uncharacterized protein (DUF1684 family)